MKMNLDNGPQTKKLENKIMLMMKDRVLGHGTTMSMLGTLDHSEAEN